MLEGKVKHIPLERRTAKKTKLATKNDKCKKGITAPVVATNDTSDRSRFPVFTLDSLTNLIINAVSDPECDRMKSIHQQK
jgi:hypothetical protein